MFFIGAFPPPSLSLSCGSGSVSHHGPWWNHKKATTHVTRAQQLLGDKERGVRWGLGVFGEEWAWSGDCPISRWALHFFQDKDKMAISTLFQHLIDMWQSTGLLNGPFIFTMASLIYESLQIYYFPFPPQANGALKPHGTPTPSPIPPGGKTLPYLPSRSGKLTWPQEGEMIASSSSFQGDHVQTSSASSWNSKVKFPEVEETATKSFGSFFLIQCVGGIFGHFKTCSF